MRWLLVVPAVIAAILISFVVAFDLGVFHSAIETKLSQKTGAKVKLGGMYILPKWPITLSVEDGKIEGERWSLEWQSFRVELAGLIPPLKIRVIAGQPRLVVSGGGEEPSHAARHTVTGGAGGGTVLPIPIHLEVRVQEGEVQVPVVHVDHFALEFEQKVFLLSQARVHFQAFVEQPVPTPVEIESDTLVLTPENVNVTDLKIALGGLRADVNGSSSISENRHHWTAKLEAPDLSKLPKPPMDMPAKDWKGSVRAGAEFNKEGAELSAQADVEAEKVSGSLDFHRDKITLQGPFNLDLTAHFKYGARTPSTPSLKAAIDLTQARLTYEDLLNKSIGVPLSAQIEATGDEKELRITKMALGFWNLNGRASGKIAMQAPYAADLQVEVPPFALKGAERVFLPLSQSPVGGQFGLRGRFTGPLTDPSAGRLAVDSFQLNNFTGEVNYDKPGSVKARGPFQLSLSGKALIEKLAVKQAEVQVHARARDLALAAGPLRKEPKQALSIDGVVRNAGTGFDIQNLTLDSFAGRMKLTGQGNYSAPLRLQFKTDIQQLNLTELRLALPQYRDKIPQGMARAHAEGSTRLPSDPEFLKRLEATGSVTADPVTWDSVQLGQIVNDVASQVKILKLQPVKLDALKGSVKSDFELRNQTVKIDNLLARDVDNSELRLHGTVAVPSLQGAMEGEFYWSKPQVQGCLLEGNSDSAGRMIIPVAFKGDMMHPGLSSLQDLVNKLGGRALECEGKKFVDKLKQDGGKQLENEVKKQLQNIFGN